MDLTFTNKHNKQTTMLALKQHISPISRKEICFQKGKLAIFKHRFLHGNFTYFPHDNVSVEYELHIQYGHPIKL
jgi:hypothetical protein